MRHLFSQGTWLLHPMKQEFYRLDDRVAKMPDYMVRHGRAQVLCRRQVAQTRFSEAFVYVADRDRSLFEACVALFTPVQTLLQHMASWGVFDRSFVQNG